MNISFVFVVTVVAFVVVPLLLVLVATDGPVVPLGPFVVLLLLLLLVLVVFAPPPATVCIVPFRLGPIGGAGGVCSRTSMALFTP